MIHFYILNQPSFTSSLNFSCRLSEKAYFQGHSITLRCDSITLAQALDEQLWSFKPESFIPHQRHGSIIEINKTSIPQKDLLINLNLARMSPDEGYQRLIQVVPDEPLAKQTARELYRHYQEQGFKIVTHTIK